VAPVVLPLGFVILGILVAKFLGVHTLFWWGLLGVCLMASLWKGLRFWPIFFLFFSVAGLRYGMLSDSYRDDSLKGLNGQTMVFRLEVDETPVATPEHYRFLGKTSQAYFGQRWHPLQAKVLVYSPQYFSLHSTIQAEGVLDELSRKGSAYQAKGCHHFYFISKAIEEKNRPFLSWASQSRESMESWFSFSLLAPYDSLAKGIFFGDHRQIEDNVMDEFRVTGTYHLLVASGLKVALVSLGIWFLLWQCPFQVRLVGAGLAVLGYAFLIGPEPPLLRGVLMALCAAIALLLGRGRDSLDAFLLVAFILLLVNPFWLFDPGFQLSFLSVFGILFFFEPLALKLSFLPKWIADSISVTISAQLPILIPLAYYFHTFSLISPLANLLVVPLSAVSMFLGSLSFGLSFLWKSAAMMVSSCHQVVLSLMLWIVKVCSEIPLAYQSVSTPNLLTIFLFYLSLVGLWLIKTRQGKILFATTSGLLACFWIRSFFVSPPTRITFLDVGQGDSAILSIQRKTFLLDAGGSPTETELDGFSVGERVVVPALRARGVNVLDGILLTHPHLDHLGGMLAVLQHFKVKRIWLPDLSTPSPLYKTFLAEAKKCKIPLLFVHDHEKIQLAEGATLNLYWPEFPLLHGTHSDLNNNSVVSQLEIGDVKILFAGDVELEGEKALLNHLHPKSLLRSQILKVPHHGSGTSSTEDFLRAVSPRIAVVSVGEHNLYHHPSPLTLKRLRKRIPYVYRTDHDGTIGFELLLDERTPRVKPIPESVSQ